MLLDTLLTQLQERGLLTTRGTQRTDSTTVLANVRRLTRLELVGETVRATLNDLAAHAPDWLRRHLHPKWRKRYEAKIDTYRLPKAKSARLEVAATLSGADIESSNAQGVRVAGLRRTRYVGLEKTHLHHLLSALALNGIRVGIWLAEPHRQVRPRSALARLVSSG